jgi:hypothetical protein
VLALKAACWIAAPLTRNPEMPWKELRYPAAMEHPTLDSRIDGRRRVACLHAAT